MNTRQFISKSLEKSQLLSEVVTVCKDLLRHCPEAEEHRFYANSRLSKYSQDRYDVGYFPSNEHLGKIISKVDLNKLKELGIIYTINVKDQYNTTFNKSVLNHHNLIWPIKDDYGNIVCLLGRSLLPSDQLKQFHIDKYKYTRFVKQAILFGLHQAKKSIRETGKVIVVEGQLDCITCHAHGLHNAVALGGTSLGPYQVFLLKKHGAKELVLLLDNDAAGEKAAQQIAKKYSHIIPIRTIKIPEFKDIDEYLRKSHDLSILMDIGS